jgi:hypothetical protein
MSQMWNSYIESDYINSKFLVSQLQTVIIKNI